MAADRAQARRAALPWLAVLAAAVAGAVVRGLLATRQRIAHNESAQVLKILRVLLPAGSFDNEPDEDRILVTAPGLLGSDTPVPVYRARQAGRPTAAVLTVIARAGYLGPIRLLVALAPDGRVLAVRAVAHQETPGLGDRIDADKSPWIGRFAGRSLSDPPAAGWAVRRDGGEFDQITGATVTSRAVVAAVRNAAEYFGSHREEIFDAPAQGSTP